MSSNKENNGEIIKDIELEMKSNHNTNSDFISIGEISKKEIAIENASSDPYPEEADHRSHDTAFLHRQRKMERLRGCIRRFQRFPMLALCILPWSLSPLHG